LKSEATTGRELLVVVPVFNEEEAIQTVITEWNTELQKHTKDFVFIVINDGSTDGTQKTLEAIHPQLGTRLEIIQRENRGHGQTCLQGYRWAVEHGFQYVFQIDSDGQCIPKHFGDVWSLRKTHDVIYGKRTHRDDGWKRSFASWVLKMVVFARSGALCADPNVPYRLMRVETLPKYLAKIPPDFFLANVALAVLLKKSRQLKHGCVRIGFRKRLGGQPKVRLGQFGGRARELVRQLGQLQK